MKDLYIVANWKENKTEEEAEIFLNEFAKDYVPREGVTVIICPPFLLASKVFEFVKNNNLPIKVGLQNISEFEEGAHTGEVSAKQASEFATYSIIGHSERRKLGETDEQVSKKVDIARKVNIEPIFCVINENVAIPQGARIVAYEPIEAIGTGNPDTPENANRVAHAIKSNHNNVVHVLYGGSVTSQNVNSFTNLENINGVLVGGASLDAIEFSSIIKNA